MGTILAIVEKRTINAVRTSVEVHAVVTESRGGRFIAKFRIPYEMRIDDVIGKAGIDDIRTFLTFERHGGVIIVLPSLTAERIFHTNPERVALKCHVRYREEKLLELLEERPRMVELLPVRYRIPRIRTMKSKIKDLVR